MKDVRVKDVTEKLEAWAPLSLAEAWDNPGLTVGNSESLITGVVTSLDITPQVVDRAKEVGANFIVSHHPYIFKGMKQITLTTAHGRLIADLLKYDISIYAMHTNLDIVSGGLNDEAVKRLGLENTDVLDKTGQEDFVKLRVFVPELEADKVRQAIGNAGAGAIGNYSHCSFSVTGTGRFLPLRGAHPAIGQVEILTNVREEEISVVVPRPVLSKVVKEMLAVHPYETPAYEVVSLDVPHKAYGLGRIGSFAQALSFDDFKERVQEAFPQAHLRLGGYKCQCIQRIALCTGGGAEFIDKAASLGADAYITGDVKYHDMQRAKELGLLVVDAGHFGTEEMAAKLLAGKIKEALGQLGRPDIEVEAFSEQRDFFF